MAEKGQVQTLAETRLRDVKIGQVGQWMSVNRMYRPRRLLQGFINMQQVYLHRFIRVSGYRGRMGIFTPFGHFMVPLVLISYYAAHPGFKGKEDIHICLLLIRTLKRSFVVFLQPTVTLSSSTECCSEWTIAESPKLLPVSSIRMERTML